MRCVHCYYLDSDSGTRPRMTGEEEIAGGTAMAKQR